MKAFQFLILFFTIVMITCCNSIAKKSNSNVSKNNFDLSAKNIQKVLEAPKAFNKDNSYKWPSDKRVIFEKFGHPDKELKNRWVYNKIIGDAHLEVEFQDCCDDIKSWSFFISFYPNFSCRSHCVYHKPEDSSQLEKFMLRK